MIINRLCNEMALARNYSHINNESILDDYIDFCRNEIGELSYREVNGDIGRGLIFDPRYIPNYLRSSREENNVRISLQKANSYIIKLNREFISDFMDDSDAEHVISCLKNIASNLSSYIKKIDDNVYHLNEVTRNLYNDVHFYNESENMRDEEHSTFKTELSEVLWNVCDDTRENIEGCFSVSRLGGYGDFLIHLVWGDIFDFYYRFSKDRDVTIEDVIRPYRDQFGETTDISSTNRYTEYRYKYEIPNVGRDLFLTTRVTYYPALRNAFCVVSLSDSNR